MRTTERRGSAGKMTGYFLTIALTLILGLASIAVFGQGEIITLGDDTLEQYAIHTSELVGAGLDHVVYQSFDDSYQINIYGNAEAIKELAKLITIDPVPFEGGYYFHVLYHKEEDHWFLDEGSACNQAKCCSHYDGDCQSK